MATIGTMLDLMVQPMYNAIRGAPVVTNNLAAKLHYKITASILVIVAFLVTSAEHFGNAIDCVQRPETVPNRILEVYCWIHSTFTLPPVAASAHPGVVDTAHPGVAASAHPGVVDTAHPGVYNRESSTVVYHKYYQWVCLVLILQAFFFYLPRYLWRMNEAGFFTKLLRTDDDELLASYLISHRGTHAPIAIYFHLGELMFVINLLGQIVLTDVFLNKQFLSLGVTSLTEAGHLQQVFPRMAKCSFHLYGPSGDLERQDALCLLGQNVFNEKIFLFLWFWYLFLLTMSTGVACWRVGTLSSKRLRLVRLMTYFNNREQFKLRKICQTLDFADWYVLTTISKNISPISCRKLYLTLYENLTKGEEREFLKKKKNPHSSHEIVPLT